MAVGSCCLSSEIYFGWLTLDGAFRAHGWLCSEDSVKILFTGPCNEFDKPSSNIRKQIQVFKVSFLTQIKVLRSDASNGNQSCDSSDPAYHTVVLVYSIFFVMVLDLVKMAQRWTQLVRPVRNFSCSSLHRAGVQLLRVKPKNGGKDRPSTVVDIAKRLGKKITSCFLLNHLNFEILNKLLN